MLGSEASMLPDEAEQIEAAISAHVQWLARLRTAIAQRSSDFTPAVVRLDNQCAFSRWLNKGIPGVPRGTPRFEEIRRAHAHFHEQAAAILELALTGKGSEAERLMSPQGEFMTTSGGLILKLRALKNA
jgi:hypothetical protein